MSITKKKWSLFLQIGLTVLWMSTPLYAAELSELKNSNLNYEAENEHSNENNAKTEDKNNYLIAVGFYNNGYNNTPISYYSHDFGDTWELSKTLPSAEGDNSYLYSVSCTKRGKCVAVGTYSFVSGNASLIYTSSDFGANWTRAQSPRAPEDSHDKLYGVSCTITGKCVAVGTYGADALPLSYTSTNFGAKWELSKTILPPQENFKNYVYHLNSVSCNNTGKCIALGTYRSKTTSNIFPLSYASSDYGVNWTKSQINKRSNVIWEKIDLKNASCNANGECIAIGVYEKEGDDKPYVLVLLSIDYGTEWQHISATPTLPGLLDISNVSCNAGGKCNALLTGSDNGQNFIHPVISTAFGFGKLKNYTTNSFPKTQYNSEILPPSLICNNNDKCIALGVSMNGDRQIPVTYTFDKTGYKETKSLNLPPDYENGDHTITGISGGTSWEVWDTYKDDD